MWSTFFPRPNGQFLVLGGSDLLPGFFVLFLAQIGNVKKLMKEIGFEKSASRCPFDRGQGGRKLFGQCPHVNNTFQKGASLRDDCAAYHAKENAAGN